MTARAVVIGSLHIDLIARASHLPGAGESVSGGTFAMAPGGKAGNQAIQLARCGVETSLLSRVGDDSFGHLLVDAIAREGVQTDWISIDGAHATGASTVFATADDYSSIICPGAAGAMTVADLEQARWIIARADIVVMQCELPGDFVGEAIAWCHALGTRVVLNASPVFDDAERFRCIPWAMLDWVIVNKVEAVTMASLIGAAGSDETARYFELRTRLGIGNLVVTLGAQGSLWIGDDGDLHLPSMPADVVDTVGAGDAFLGALIAAILHGDSMETSLRRANAAGALAVTRTGAYAALPTSKQIDAYLSNHS